MDANREEWRTIPEFPRYEASSLGRVRYAATGRVRKATYQTGAEVLSLRPDGGPSTTRNVGALILMAFTGPRPDGCECSHLNGDHRDNRAQNLAWETKPVNMARKAEHGTLSTPRMQGSVRAGAVLTEATVATIRERLAAGATNRELAAEYGVSTTTISKIKHRKKWSHV